MNRINIEKKFEVSVVVPFYNRSKFLRRLLDSILSQTLMPKKIFIVDNGSSLEEAAKACSILQSHKLFNICCYTSSLGRGNANYARNLGYYLADTEYVAFLDSDDWWKEDHLYESLKFLKSSDKVAVYSGAIVHNYNGSKVNKSIDVNQFTNPFSLIMSSKGYLAQTSSYIVNKDRVKNNVLWDESLKRHQDFDYFASIYYYTSGWCFFSDINVNIDWGQGGTKKNIDFSSLLLFYNKWQDRIPNIIKKHYLFKMLCLSYKLGASCKVKSFYYEKIADLNFFEDNAYRIKCSRCYLIPYRTLYFTLESTGWIRFVRSVLKK